MQRTIGASAESEGLLRFWLDCTSGASKGDVTVDAGERIFFSTGVWDDAEEVRRMVRSRDELDAKDKDKAADAETPKSALEQVPNSSHPLVNDGHRFTFPWKDHPFPWQPCHPWTT